MKFYLKDSRISNAVIKVSKANTVSDAKLVLLVLDSIFEQSNSKEVESTTCQTG